MRGRDLAALILLAAIWGSSYLFIRVAVEPLGPLVVALLRVVVAGLGLLAYAQFSRRRGELRALDIRFLTLGAANAAVPYSLISLAELHITASMAGILNATTPLFTAMVVAGWNKERITRRTMLGLGLGFAGVAVLVGWDPAPLNGWLVIAVVAMLVASLSYAFATVYAKRMLRGVSSLGAATGQQIGGTILLLPFGLATVANGSSDTSPSVRVALAIVALGLLCTSFAYLLYFHLITSVGPVNTASTTFLIPIFGILWSALFLDEAVHRVMLIGLALILGSVALVNGLRLPGLGRWPKARQAPAD